MPRVLISSRPTPRSRNNLRSRLRSKGNASATSKLAISGSSTFSRNTASEAPSSPANARRLASARRTVAGLRSMPVTGPRSARAIESPPILQQRSATGQVAGKRAALYRATWRSMACWRAWGRKNIRSAWGNLATALRRNSTCSSRRWARASEWARFSSRTAPTDEPPEARCWSRSPAASEPMSQRISSREESEFTGRPREREIRKPIVAGPVASGYRGRFGFEHCYR